GPWISGGVHHVGSTAIVGSVAKPTIDIMVGVKNLTKAKACISLLEEIGYSYSPYREAYTDAKAPFVTRVVETASGESVCYFATNYLVLDEPYRRGAGHLQPG